MESGQKGTIADFTNIDLNASEKKYHPRDLQRCDDPSPPTSFANGKSYQSCLVYLIPGGGSIKSVEWKDGPAPANDVSAYYDRPVVWGA